MLIICKCVVVCVGDGLLTCIVLCVGEDVRVSLNRCLNTLEFSRFVVHWKVTGQPSEIGLELVWNLSLWSAPSSEILEQVFGSRYLNVCQDVLFLHRAS
jgi:hypothetical protein